MFRKCWIFGTLFGGNSAPFAWQAHTHKGSRRIFFHVLRSLLALCKNCYVASPAISLFAASPGWKREGKGRGADHLARARPPAPVATKMARALRGLGWGVFCPFHCHEKHGIASVPPQLRLRLADLEGQ